MLEVRIASLKPGIHRVELRPEAPEVGLSPDEFREIAVDATLDVAPERIFIHLEAEAMATLECDRTAVMFEQPVRGSYDVLFTTNSEDVEADEEVRTFRPFDASIDIAEPVRDTLILALPTRRVAPGAEDAELPVRFGATEDTGDPRWEALRRLKDQGPS